MAQQKAMATQLRQQASAVEKLRLQLGNGPADTPAAKLSREIERMTAERSALDAQIASLTEATGVALPAVLERVLRRHDKLTLLGLATALPDPGAGGAAAGGAAAPRLQRQAVDIRMRGSYPDLARYVADTEAALPALRWGALKIISQSGDAELSAQVFLTGGRP
jgi:MSHA biogenesis protein MshJ